MLDSTHFRELQAVGLDALTIHNGQDDRLNPFNEGRKREYAIMWDPSGVA